MRPNMKRLASRGFTLLEVLLATAIMAVGTTSVLVVIATAAGMASQRQVNVRREQVLDEARHDAQAMVDAFRPGTAVAAAPVPGAKKGTKTDTVAANLAPPKVEGKKSERFDGFTYDVTFEPKDRLILEKGYDVTIVVHYGGGELSATASTSMISTTIPDDEFLTSSTWQEEQKGLANRDKTRETR